MGIQALLQFLSKRYSAREACISEFENEFVAIDAYCWLHKGIYSCAYDIATNKPTTKYVDYCMRYVHLLLHFNVKPILVFDGKKLPSKLATEEKREEDRKNKYLKGMELMRAGQISEGKKLIAESVDVSHKLALGLIKACRELDIDCIVAPYEADAQLAYLSINNIVKCIITEDSDLLAYGCEKVMLKMGQNGMGELYEINPIYKSLDFESNSNDIFRYMCILAGCDYLPSLPSIGPAYAYKFVKMLNGNNILEALPRLPVYLNKMGVKVTPEYIQGFIIADKTFKHQLVYDPFHRREIPLRPVVNEDDIVGEKSPKDFAYQVALGNIDPITMKQLDNYDPDESGKGFNILWTTDGLPQATSRPVTIKERKSGYQENAGVWFKNHSEKERNIKQFANYKSTKKPVNNVPKTVFDFEPSLPNIKKNEPKTVNESNLLKSRYFCTKQEKVPKKTENHSTARQKDESYDEYLQRLYTEHFSVDDDDQKENSEFCCKKQEEMADETKLRDSCPKCSKCSKCCECSPSRDISNTQVLNERMKELGLLKVEKQESSHSILDEMQKVDDENKSVEKVDSLKETFLDVKYTDCSLSVKEDRELEVEAHITADQDIGDIELIPSQSQERRSVSPVLIVQKDSKALNSSFKRESFIDTAGTPTSVYFSSSTSQLSRSFSVGSSKTTPALSSRKIPSVKRSGGASTSGKSNSKTTPAARTLFQFGFKKQRMSKEDS